MSTLVVANPNLLAQEKRNKSKNDTLWLTPAIKFPRSVGGQCHLSRQFRTIRRKPESRY